MSQCRLLRLSWWFLHGFPFRTAQRCVTFHSASSPVSSEEVGDDDDDSVVATHVDKSLIRVL